jgi:hypothetical protein
LTAGLITGCIQLGSHPPPAAFLTFFLVLAHTSALERPMHGYAVLKPAFNAPSLREINLIFIIANIIPEGNSGMSSQKEFKKLNLYAKKMKKINNKMKKINFLLDNK